MQKINNYTEQQIIEIVDKIGNILSNLYSFSYYTREDIKQEVWVFCLQALPKYDNCRGLDKFLYVHARNRILNLLRDKYYRSQCPCKLCYSGQTHENGEHCKTFLIWKQRNLDKISISNLASLEDSVVYNDNSVENNEIIDYIDDVLDPKMREYYLKLKAGQKIGKTALQELRKALDKLWKSENAAD